MYLFHKFYNCNLTDRSSPIESVEISRTHFPAAECEKARQSPARPALRWNRCRRRDSEGTKLIVPVVAKVSQPCVILIGLMPTSYSATHPCPPPFSRVRAFSALFPGTAIAAGGRLAIWKFPAGRMCRILRGGFYVSDAISRLQWTASRRSLSAILLLFYFLLLSDAAWV